MSKTYRIFSLMVLFIFVLHCLAEAQGDSSTPKPGDIPEKTGKEKKKEKKEKTKDTYDSKNPVEFTFSGEGRYTSFLKGPVRNCNYVNVYITAS
ncbi:MAG TPA: hypothetical protein VNV85_06135, partial [Puia sp.]|nr:hypothetical protein [Puia sp.]